ncbi:hypothetical protein A6E15_15925 [Natrinema saccharevitans]|uniref:Uncharacterized protein n=1 Tax=Natrinema saccharevitans TaxID=301967 RepID=A0A1S8AZY4_9EURY|nr:hypothetical protein [Natrinema saccharevitans]OLZ42363.1 hypothetical protein A6E15_15925 [Natrinema saccharevitans]
MLRRLLLGFGFLVIVKPEPVIAACERVGLRNPDEPRPRPLALVGARLEGLAFVWLLVRGRQGSTLLSGLFGLAGLTLVLVPRPIIDLSQHLVYVNTDDLELQPWVEPAARLLGVLYLTVTLLPRSGNEESAAEERESGDTESSGRLPLPAR